MALSDMVTHLEGVEGEMDPSLQGPVSDALMKLLEDKSSDVQTKAVARHAAFHISPFTFHISHFTSHTNS